MVRSVLRPNSGTAGSDTGHLEDPLFTRSIARALDVLSAFHHSERPLSLSELAQAAQIDRSAAQRIVHTLRKLGYIRRDDQGRGFLPDIRILDHTLDYLRLHPLVRRATPVLLELRRNVRERVDLSLFDDLRVVYAARMQSKRETFHATLVGHSVPTFCSSGGRAILSCLEESEVEDIIARSDKTPFTPKTLTDPAAIGDKVAEARETGYAITLEEILIGEIAIGMALPDSDGRPCGAIHVAGSLSEWTPEEFTARFAPLISEAAADISR